MCSKWVMCMAGAWQYRGTTREGWPGMMRMQCVGCKCGEESSSDEIQGQAPRCNMEHDQDKGTANMIEEVLVGPGL